MSCDKGCTTARDLIVRVARQLGDYSDEVEAERFVTWSFASLVDYYNEAAMMMVANRPDTFAKTVDLTLTPGSLQKLPAGYKAFVKIELNVGSDGAEAASVIPGDEYFTKIMAKKQCLPSGCAAQQSDYAVKSFTKSSFSDTEFTVSPPVPPGMAPVVKAVVISPPTKICPGDVDECVEFDATYSGAIVEWMLYRVWGSDAEIVGGSTAAATHARMFFQMLGVQLQREREFFAGAFRAAQTQAVQR